MLIQKIGLISKNDLTTLSQLLLIENYVYDLITYESAFNFL